MKKYLILCGVLLGAVVSSAQLYPSKLGLTGSAAFHLGENRIQVELGLSSDQVSVIQKTLSAHAEVQNKLNAKLAGAKQDQYQPIQRQLEAQEKSTVEKMLAVLNTKQKDRLYQLAVQDAGPFALRNDATAKKVGLTPEQKASVQKIAVATITMLDEINAKMGAALEAAPAGKAGDKKRTAIVKSFDPRMKQVEKKGEQDVLALLTKVQIVKWNATKGKPYKL